MAAKKKSVGPQYREFQFLVQAILLLDEEGGVPRAESQEPVVLNGLEELHQYLAQFPSALAQLNESLQNASKAAVAE